MGKSLVRSTNFFSFFGKRAKVKMEWFGFFSLEIQSHKFHKNIIIECVMMSSFQRFHFHFGALARKRKYYLF